MQRPRAPPGSLGTHFIITFWELFPRGGGWDPRATAAKRHCPSTADVFILLTVTQPHEGQAQKELLRQCLSPVPRKGNPGF